MNREQLTARLKIPGLPVLRSDGARSAVWCSDTITPIRRVGSRWYCHIAHGHGLYRCAFRTYIPKRYLRVS